MARRGDVDPTSLGACAVEEIPGRSARAGDLILVVKRRMANAEPFTVLLAMTEERAADLEAGFQQPTSEASRRPISMQVRKNILAYAPRCQAQGIISQSARTYLVSWCQGRWPKQRRMQNYSYLRHRCSLPFPQSPGVPDWNPPRVRRLEMVFGDGEPEDDTDDNEDFDQCQPIDL